MSLLKIEERKSKNETFMREICEESLAAVNEGKVIQIIIILEREHSKGTTAIQIKRSCKSTLEMHGLLAHAAHQLLEGK